MRTCQLPRVKKIHAPLGVAWQVTATVQGQRRKSQFYVNATHGNAEQQARSLAAKWADEQAGATVTFRRANTWLSDEQLRAAEGRVSKGTDFPTLALTPEQLSVAQRIFSSLPDNYSYDTLIEIVQRISPLSAEQVKAQSLLFQLLPPTLGVEDVRRLAPIWSKEVSRPKIDLRSAADKFLASRTTQAGQTRTYRGLLKALCEGRDRMPLAAIDEEILQSFLSRYENGTTYNKRKVDLASFFNWALKHELIEKSPLRLIANKPEEAKDEMPEILLATQAMGLMHAVEAECPGLVPHYALCLFAGTRPTWREGESFELVHRFPQRRHLYFRENAIHVPGIIAKNGGPRVIPYGSVAPLNEWLKAYPPGRLAIPPNPEKLFANFRQRFGIPHDGLRHTAVSLGLASGLSFAQATMIYDVDEPTMRTHYAALMPETEAAKFKTIVPKSNYENLSSQ